VQRDAKPVIALFDPPNVLLSVNAHCLQVHMPRFTRRTHVVRAKDRARFAARLERGRCIPQQLKQIIPSAHMRVRIYIYTIYPSAAA